MESYACEIFKFINFECFQIKIQSEVTSKKKKKLINFKIDEKFSFCILKSFFVLQILHKYFFLVIFFFRKAENCELEKL